MSKSDTGSKGDFHEAARPAPAARACDLRHMIALTFMAAMETVYQIDAPLARLEGDDESGYSLELLTTDPLNREDQMSLIRLDEIVSDSIAELDGFSLAHDIENRVIRAPLLETYIALLSRMEAHATRHAALTIHDLLEAQSRGAHSPAMQLH